MKTVIFNPKSWVEAADFADYELLNGKAGEQVDMLILPETNPGLVAWLFGRVDEFNRFRNAGEPKLLLEGVSYVGYSGLRNETLVSFRFEKPGDPVK